MLDLTIGTKWVKGIQISLYYFSYNCMYIYNYLKKKKIYTYIHTYTHTHRTEESNYLPGAYSHCGSTLQEIMPLI